MFKNFNRTTTTTIIGLMIVIFSFGFFFMEGAGVLTHTNAVTGQLISNLLMLITGYYFGSSKDKDTKNV